MPWCSPLVSTHVSVTSDSHITTGKNVKYFNNVIARFGCSLGSSPVKGTVITFKKNASVNSTHIPAATSNCAAIADPRVSLHVLPRNEGACAAMNHAIRRARGEFVAVLNSDDLFLPGKRGHAETWTWIGAVTDDQSDIEVGDEAE